MFTKYVTHNDWQSRSFLILCYRWSVHKCILNIYSWISENRVNTLHFDYTTPKGLKSILSDGYSRDREEQEKEKRVEEKKTDLPKVFISSTLEKKKWENEQDTDAIFFNTAFINPDIYRSCLKMETKESVANHFHRTYI